MRPCSLGLGPGGLGLGRAGGRGPVRAECPGARGPKRRRLPPWAPSARTGPPPPQLCLGRTGPRETVTLFPFFYLLAE